MTAHGPLLEHSAEFVRRSMMLIMLTEQGADVDSANVGAAANASAIGSGLIEQPFVWGPDVKRTAWLLAIALTALGCDTADEVEPGSDTADSAQVGAPAAIDTTSVVAHPSPERALRAALEQVLRGPSDPQPEEHSWFSSVTADALRSVSVDSAGHATVDFEDLRALIPNASSSAGSTMLLEELNSTVFGVEGVRSVDYLIEGSCERFWEWLQYGCQTIHRP